MTSKDTPQPHRPPSPDTPPPVGAIEHGDGPLPPAAARLADLADARDRLAVLDGLSPQVWLEQACRMTRTEARRLLAAADTLQHLPAVVRGLQDGRLSWSQAQGIASAARDCPADRRAALDASIASVLDEFRTYEPDELVDQVWLTVAGWAPRGGSVTRPPPTGPNTSPSCPACSTAGRCMASSADPLRPDRRSPRRARRPPDRGRPRRPRQRRAGLRATRRPPPGLRRTPRPGRGRPVRGPLRGQPGRLADRRPAHPTEADRVHRDHRRGTAGP